MIYSLIKKTAGTLSAVFLCYHRNMKKICLLLLTLLLTLTLFANGNSEEATASVISFESVDIFGNSVSSQELFSSSKITMINFWATYCNPCIGELPFLAKIPTYYDPSELQIIGIITDVTNQNAYDKAISLIKEKGADSYIHLLPSSSMKDVLSNISVVPTTLFVNNKGEIIKSVLGSNTFKRWQEIISEL